MGGGVVGVIANGVKQSPALNLTGFGNLLGFVINLLGFDVETFIEFRPHCGRNWVEIVSAVRTELVLNFVCTADGICKLLYMMMLLFISSFRKIMSS
jgi:hypothetical protein